MNFFSRITAAFREMPIRRKLRVIFTLTTVVALFFAGFGIVAADTVLFYNYLQRDLVTFAKVIGDSAAGGLEFDDLRASTESLSALKARTHVQTACLFRKDGSLLVQYARDNYNGACPRSNGESILSSDGALVVSHQVRFRGAYAG